MIARKKQLCNRKEAVLKLFSKQASSTVGVCLDSDSSIFQLEGDNSFQDAVSFKAKQ